MDAIDRRELDRIYARLLGQWSAPQRDEDTLGLGELQALMDRVRKDEAGAKDTDVTPPESAPIS